MSSACHAGIETKDPAAISASKAAFVAGSNGAYGYGGHTTLRVDEMRTNEFPQMEGSVYLDHAGATMYSKIQLDAVFRELQDGLFTNPHSTIGHAQVDSTSAKIENVRRQVLMFLSASEEEYTLVFTSGATAALKLVGESFPWSESSTFAHSTDSHTSVLGIREYAAARGSTVQCVELNELKQLEQDASANRAFSAEAVCSPFTEPSEISSTSLFAFPAECNFSGTRHNLNAIVNQVHAGCWNSSSNKDTRWLVLLDAAKYVATHRLDLSTCHPDFVTLSFYKIFGYPTGLGALVMRKSAMSYLKKHYHGGGTVQSILAGRNYFVPRGMDDKNSSSRFADGTQSFLSILSLRHGIEQVEKLGMARISAHTASLRALLVGRLAALKHGNGRPICVVYGNGSNKMKAKEEGPTIACNFLRSDGSYVGYSEVHKLSEIHNIHLRTGCFCNPGACQYYLGLKESDLITNIAAGHVCGDDIDLVYGLPTGAVRLSLGYMSTFEDVAVFVEFVSKYFVCKSAPADPATSLSSTSLSLGYVSKGPHLCKITLFPIKSCSGMVVNAWPIGSRGLLFDREFAIVDLSTSTALTLKALPELCFLFPTLDLERQTLTISYRTPDASTSRQSVTSPPSPEPQTLPVSFTIPLHADTSIIKSHVKDDPRRVRVCADMCRGRDVDADVSQWLSSCLGRPCALVRVSSNHLRTSQTTRSKRALHSNAKEKSETQGLELLHWYSSARSCPVDWVC
ncbi:unnamed protein product [Peronospora destructor]|uniref:Molybdenum cofactor sulfurase n=1 Tax=Peronospora destructor TaxID=86335 RepID=A0AAV0TDQ0_9STRA|nr:unnamed protein product [Peronospora destructor]